MTQDGESVLRLSSDLMWPMQEALLKSWREKQMMRLDGRLEPNRKHP